MPKHREVSIMTQLSEGVVRRVAEVIVAEIMRQNRDPVTPFDPEAVARAAIEAYEATLQP
jgi:hypothetical protein